MSKAAKERVRVWLSEGAQEAVFSNAPSTTWDFSVRPGA